MSKMDVLAKLATKAPKLAPKLGRVGLQLQKASPEILFGVGVAAVVGGVVLACRSTLKVDEILDEHNEQMEKIENGFCELDSYSEEDMTKDKAMVYVKTGVSLAKSYLPAITTLGLGIACFAASHNIQHQRIAGLAAAYKTIESGFKSYRGRVVEALGEEQERELYFNAKKEKLDYEEVDETTGKTRKAKKEVKTVVIDGASEYARYFDENCSQWNRNADYRMDFLKMTESYMNDRLHLIGHVFLNEVYDALGMERSRAGSVVGWLDGNPDGDNYVDFGLSQYFYNGSYGSDYVVGKENSLLLDFNVDGTIFDKI